MFGSIVVFLPSEFKGGELIFRHDGQQYTVDYATEKASSTAEEGKTIIPWTAFFSDVEHEVLPVTEGYRVSLTYVSSNCYYLKTVTNHFKEPLPR